MDESQRIRELYDRKTRAYGAKPSLGWGRGACSARLEEGLACTTTFGDHRLTMDLPVTDGGTGQGPTPGQVMRSGLAACLAIGYRLWGHRSGVVLDEVAVDVTCELDVRGQLGIDGIPVGWQRITWTVDVASDAPETDVLRVLDAADRASPMLASLDRGIVRERVVHLRRRAS